MKNQSLLAGAVMLETMWQTRKKDLVDLISPLILYSVAQICSEGEMVDIRRVCNIVKERFGYPDMPKSIIEIVLKREKQFFQKKCQEYYLISSLDENVEKIDKRKIECEQIIRILGQQVADYLEANLKSRKKYTAEDAFSELQGFFSRQGIYLGTNKLEECESQIKSSEIDYYISHYLIEKKINGEIEFDYALNLVKGYFLQAAIYLQAENGSITKASYKNLDIYLDTPIILRLLGLKTEEETISAKELVEALKSQKGKIKYFPQTQKEVMSILTAYQHSIGRPSRFTLEGLDDRGYTAADVERLKLRWERDLSIDYNVNLEEVMTYVQRTDGTVDLSYMIDECELRDYIKENTKWRTEEAFDADILSALSIHSLRGKNQATSIEHSQAIFVTTNVPFVRAFNKFYKEKVSDRVFPLLITDADLAALTWVKCGTKTNLPERQLLCNAYMATQPSSDLMEKFAIVLDKMLREGSITEELAVVIRESQFAKNEILFSSFDGKAIDENLVLKIRAQIKKEYSDEARLDERKRAEEARKEEVHRQYENAFLKASKAADTAKTKYLSSGRKKAKIVFGGLLVLSLIGVGLSLSGIINCNWFVGLTLTVLALANLFSIIDVWKQRAMWFDKWLIRKADQKYREEFEQKKAEYLDLLKVDSVK